ncbi:MAG TPA: acyl-CoA reductase [Polyangiaceae bacterium]|nr:acyl-CoA reductase [Polyangiaceae bacterium]
MSDDRQDRLRALLRAAERLADPHDALGREAREALLASSGLSPQGVELALTRHLEHRAGRAAVTQLVRRGPAVPAAHVLLSANVFVAAFRAIAVALAQSGRVFVRPSRREPTFARLLAEGSGGAFELVDQLSPRAGEHLWAYGTEETLRNLRGQLPAGVLFHPHGPGLGVALLSERGLVGTPLVDAARALAADVIAFDQRGCLSPRLVLVQGDPSLAEQFADALALWLEDAEKHVPRGRLSADEDADALRYEHTMAYVGGARRAGQGLVVVERQAERLFVPPVGRYLSVVTTSDPLARLADLGARVTTVGLLGDDALPGRVQAVLGRARVVPFGRMQLPPLDGPVDQRSGWDAETI